MARRYWFRQKRYGYGATPVTWEGWVFTVAAAVIVGVGLYALSNGHGPLGTAGMMSWWIGLIVVVVTLIGTVVVTKAKTEGGWQWRWGGPK